MHPAHGQRTDTLPYRFLAYRPKPTPSLHPSTVDTEGTPRSSTDRESTPQLSVLPACRQTAGKLWLLEGQGLPLGARSTGSLERTTVLQNQEFLLQPQLSKAVHRQRQHQRPHEALQKQALHLATHQPTSLHHLHLTESTSLSVGGSTLLPAASVRQELHQLQNVRGSSGKSIESRTGG